MEIMKILVLLMSLILILSGCSLSKNSALEYQKNSFSALISWSVGELRTTAMINAAITQEGDKEITLCFDSPASLKGLTLTQNGNSFSSSLGPLKIPISYAKDLMRIADFFNINGTFKRSYLAQIDNQKFNCVEFLSNEGKHYTVYLHPKTALPRRICGIIGNENIILEVLEFNPT